MINDYDIMLQSEYNLMDTNNQFNYDQSLYITNFFLEFGKNTNDQEVKKNKKEFKLGKLASNALVGSALIGGTLFGLGSAILSDATLNKNRTLKGVERRLTRTNMILDTLIENENKNI